MRAGFGKARASEISATTVRRFWDREENAYRLGGSQHWLEIVPVARRVNARVSGDPDVDPYTYVLTKYFLDRAPVERALTLGCGAGELERHPAMLWGPGFCRRHDGYDIAEGAIQRARRAAAARGLSHVHYQVADLNTLTLPPEAYDCVFGAHSVHHLERLEHVFSQVLGALKPGGLFVLNEFVGPSRFQWTDRQLEAANQLLLALPQRLRQLCPDHAGEKAPIMRPSVADMIRIDPSEAVRSAEILSLLPRYFDVTEVRGYGGSVLHLLLEGIAGNFAENDPESLRLLAEMCELEEQLIADGELQHDFAVIVARKP